MGKNIYLLFIATALLFVSSCNSGSKKTRKEIVDSLNKEAIKDWNSTIPGSFTEQSDLVFDSLKLNQFLEKYPKLKIYKDSIQKFYISRDYSYAWFNKNGLIEQAGNLADRMRNLNEEGLKQEVPYIKELDSLIFSNDHSTKQEPNTEIELMLTGQYFTFADIAWKGSNEQVSKSVNWYLPRKKVSFNQYLDSLVKGDSHVDNIEGQPVYRQYILLKKYLNRYQELQKKETVDKIIADKKSYKLGDSSSVIAAIRKRLVFLGDFEGDTLNYVYDTELEKGIKQFQERHGLINDGVVGLGTISEMNVPIKTRIKTLMVNMERSKWMPVGLDREYLGINIPEFKLHVYKGDSLVWSCNVVVGKDIHKTVVFYGEMKHIVFSPYWNVPQSIVKNEILPAMNRNSNYLAKHRMEITGKAGGLPVIRQLPGPQNSLGLVKFLFPNSYNIYLHDTPSKSLFTQESRAFSHGCIRVSEPKKLAEFLLKHDETWTSEKIDAAMHQNKEKWVTLKDKVPVFIAYFTSFVDRNGLINFRKDIYERDNALAEMILK